MSYCVNCGVELEPSLTECPLCNTPVINPKELYNLKHTSPYPQKKGQVDVVKKTDLTILLCIILIATSLSCLALNFFVFSQSMWSLFIIGACLIIFVFAIPVIIYTRLPIYISLLFDGIAVGFYLYMITFNTAENEWFFRLALPIVALVTILVEIFTLLLRSFPVSALTTALYLFSEIAFLCVGVELLIRHYTNAPLKLVWSAVVLTVCCVIVVMLLTMLSRRRLRDAVRRRLHF
ncbi:MAG: DUF6320 domain-containing protein [Clostridium sp.]|nr:DUF6320 domain-containing protein [Clostridium sp.]